MPFCTNCGKPVTPTDQFCGSCGTRQTAPGQSAGPVGATSDPLRNVSPRTAAIFCYIPVVGWIMSVVILASPAFGKDRTLRFHAFQGIYLFVAWLLIQWVLEPMFGWMDYPGARMLRVTTNLLEMAVYAAWIWMLVKTSQQQFYSLPIIGELAERSVAEQL